jgi:hypothetical protein
MGWRTVAQALVRNHRGISEVSRTNVALMPCTALPAGSLVTPTIALPLLTLTARGPMKVLAPRVPFCALAVPHGLPINNEVVTIIRNLTDTLLTETKCGPNKNRCRQQFETGCCAFPTCAWRIVNCQRFWGFMKQRRRADRAWARTES